MQKTDNIMRVVYVVRHAQSEGTRYDREAYGPLGGRLLPSGIQEAKALTSQFKALGVDVVAEPVAVSELQRTHQTAYYAGFAHVNQYGVLNEVMTGLEPEILEEYLARREAPAAAIIAAQSILASPPEERVWVTHGLVVAGLAHELGVSPDDVFVPKQGSITRFELP